VTQGCPLNHDNKNAKDGKSARIQPTDNDGKNSHGLFQWHKKKGSQIPRINTTI